MKDQKPKKKSGGLEDQARRHRGFPWRKHLSGDFLMKKTKTKFFVCQKGGEEVSILRHNKIVLEKILRQKSTFTAGEEVSTGSDDLPCICQTDKMDLIQPTNLYQVLYSCISRYVQI